MNKIIEFIQQVREYLIKEGARDRDKAFVYDHFRDRCEFLKLSEEEFYTLIYERASKQILVYEESFFDKSRELSEAEASSAKQSPGEAGLPPAPKGAEDLSPRGNESKEEEPKSKAEEPVKAGEAGNGNAGNGGNGTNGMSGAPEAALPKKTGRWLMTYLYYLISLASFTYLGYVIHLMLRDSNSQEPYPTLYKHFDWSCVALGVIIILVRFYRVHSSRRWNKPPAFLSDVVLFIGAAMVFIPFFFGFHTDKLVKYDASGEEDGWHWFFPSAIVDFPLKQIELNREFRTMNYPKQGVDVTGLSQGSRGVKKLFVTLVDRTASGKENERFWKMNKSERLRLLSFRTGRRWLKVDTLAFINYGIRDYMASCVDSFVRCIYPDTVTSSIMILFDGNGENTVIDLMQGRFSNSGIKYPSDYFNIARKADSITSTLKKTGITDFAEFFRYASDTINALCGKDTFDVYLHIISDFYHEPLDNYERVNTTLSDLFFDSRQMRIRQVNLYQLPLYKVTSEKQAAVNEMIRIFDRQFDLVNIYKTNVERSIAASIPTIAAEQFAPACGPAETIRFYYLSSEPQVNTSISLHLPKGPDSIICRITNSNPAIRDDDFYFTYWTEDSVKHKSFLNTPFSMDSVSKDYDLKIEFHKRHMPANSTDLWLEIFSRGTNTKYSIPIEFCEVLPNTTSKFFIFLYAILYASGLLFTLLPLHFIFIKINSDKKVISLFRITLINLSLLSLLASGLLFFIFFLIKNKTAPVLFQLTILVMVIGVVTPALLKYRYYISKYLYYSNKDFYQQSMKDYIGRVLVRRNRDNPGRVEKNPLPVSQTSLDKYK